MTKWLASVQSLTEVQTLATCLPDIVDMKQPSQGALGALSVDTVKSIVDWLDGKTLSSATIGDLPMQATVIAPAIQEMAQTGVDYVKVGLFEAEDLQTCLMQLETCLKSLSVPVIAVMFADQCADIELVKLLKKVGFTGVMVDTANKDGRGLMDHWSFQQIQTFVYQAKSHSMLCGLAGALKLEDIEVLKCLGADYLGFRSALCIERNRTAELQIDRVEAIQHCLLAELNQAV